MLPYGIYCIRKGSAISGRQRLPRSVHPTETGSGKTRQEERAMPGLGRMLWLAIGVLATVAVPGEAVSGGRAETVLLADQDRGDGGDMNIDLAVRQVTV